MALQSFDLTTTSFVNNSIAIKMSKLLYSFKRLFLKDYLRFDKNCIGLHVMFCVSWAGRARAEADPGL